MSWTTTLISIWLAGGVLGLASGVCFEIVRANVEQRRIELRAFPSSLDAAGIAVNFVLWPLKLVYAVACLHLLWLWRKGRL